MDAYLLSLASLFAVALATSAVPGPTNLLIMRVALRRGRGPAVAAALGTTLGCVVWCAAAAAGLAALFAAAPWLYQAMRIAGGLYLLWFAFDLWRSPAEPPSEAGREATGQAFTTGLLICLTNPKSVLFFAAVFSAYVGPAVPAWVQGAAITVVTATCLAWCASLGWLFSSPRAARAYAAAQKPLDRVAAVLMALFGLSLLWTFR